MKRCKFSNSKNLFLKIFMALKKQFKYFLNNINIIQCIFESLIMAIIASVLSTVIIEVNNNNYMYNSQREKLIADLKTVTIGCNKSWMDSVFGEPVFTNIDEITQEDVYITEIALIRAFWGLEDDSCKMFFITKTTDEPIPFLSTINNIYYNSVGKELKLGTLSYNQIQYSNMKLLVAYGYFTNGSGRTFYGEGYDPFYSYLYPTYYASVDYGEPSSYGLMKDLYSGSLSKEEKKYYEASLSDFANIDLNAPNTFLHNRSEFYPNTYGLSSFDSEYTFGKLSDYNTFDSIQLAYKNTD